MRILVVFHVFYEHLVDYYLDRMGNLNPYEWNLLVTGHNLSQATVDRIRKTRENAVFLDSDNVGYDVWPFISAVKTVNLDDYDIVIKLHTKNEDGSRYRLHGEAMTGADWRRYMVDALIKDAETAAALVAMFKENDRLGIAYSQKLNFKSNGIYMEDGSMLEDELNRLGIVRTSSMFCAGTMFAVRACTLKFLQRDDISASIFHKSGPSHGYGTMAHVYERLIPIGVVSQGYELKLIPYSKLSSMKFALWNVMGPAVKWLLSVDYFGADHIKRVRLFGHTFIFEKRKQSGC